MEKLAWISICGENLFAKQTYQRLAPFLILLEVVRGRFSLKVEISSTKCLCKNKTNFSSDMSLMRNFPVCKDGQSSFLYFQVVQNLDCKSWGFFSTVYLESYPSWQLWQFHVTVETISKTSCKSRPSLKLTSWLFLRKTFVWFCLLHCLKSGKADIRNCSISKHLFKKVTSDLPTAALAPGIHLDGTDFPVPVRICGWKVVNKAVGAIIF